MEVKYIPATILACCVLYNICIDENNNDFLQEGLNKVDIVDEDDFTNYEPIERQRPEFLKKKSLSTKFINNKYELIYTLLFYLFPVLFKSLQNSYFSLYAATNGAIFQNFKFK